MADTSTHLSLDSHIREKPDTASKTASKAVPVTDKEDDFQGFNQDEMRHTVLVLISCGIVMIFVQCLPATFAGIVSLVVLGFLYEWYRIHGNKLTRDERTFLDEASLLQCTSGYDVGMEMCDAAITPYEGGKDVVPPGPSSIVGALFADPKKTSMEKFYKEHYGGMWERAQKAMKEKEFMDKQII